MVQSGRPSLIHSSSMPRRTTPHSRRGVLPEELFCIAQPAQVAFLLLLGVDPDIQGRGDHTPLYCVANECASKTGPDVVRALVQAGVDVNACSG